MKNNNQNPPKKEFLTPNAKRKEMLLQAFQLLSTAVNSLTVCSQAQNDEQAQKLLDPAIKHQWEARYWLSETIAYLEAKEEEDKKSGNAN